MFDSLNRLFLEPYRTDGEPGIPTPNFTRLANRGVTFDNSYVGSMPCMPARRELHTARPNFLHRAWGPIEPFDDSMPEMLKQAGVHTALISDHQHYWEDGGATYHTRYSIWQHHRGQEGDPWMGQVAYQPPAPNAEQRNAIHEPNPANPGIEYQDRVNRTFYKSAEDYPQQRTFAAGLDFLDRNADQDQWFLQIETFDPHEPFLSTPEFTGEETAEQLWDWPEYSRLCPEDTPERVAWMRARYGDLVRQCDANLGRVLDTFDRLDLWKDTMLIVATDHGFLLGEHDCWAKSHTPWWDIIARTPFFVWDPRQGTRGERRQGLVQPMLDIPVTLLRAFGLEPTGDMRGGDLAEVIRRDTDIRPAGLFGRYGGHVNVTDGRYVYMRAPANADNTPLYEYTLMPTRMRKRFDPEELSPARVRLQDPLSFTKGAPLLRIEKPAGQGGPALANYPRSMLFDTRYDPGQTSPIEDSAVEVRMCSLLIRAMQASDAPAEQFERLGLDVSSNVVAAN